MLIPKELEKNTITTSLNLAELPKNWLIVWTDINKKYYVLNLITGKIFVDKLDEIRLKWFADWYVFKKWESTVFVSLSGDVFETPLPKWTDWRPHYAIEWDFWAQSYNTKKRTTDCKSIRKVDLFRISTGEMISEFEVIWKDMRVFNIWNGILWLNSWFWFSVEWSKAGRVLSFEWKELDSLKEFPEDQHLLGDNLINSYKNWERFIINNDTWKVSEPLTLYPRYWEWKIFTRRKWNDYLEIIDSDFNVLFSTFSTWLKKKDDDSFLSTKFFWWVIFIKWKVFNEFWKVLFEVENYNEKLQSVYIKGYWNWIIHLSIHNKEHTDNGVEEFKEHIFLSKDWIVINRIKSNDNINFTNLSLYENSLIVGARSSLSDRDFSFKLYNTKDIFPTIEVINANMVNIDGVTYYCKWVDTKKDFDQIKDNMTKIDNIDSDIVSIWNKKFKKNLLK